MMRVFKCSHCSRIHLEIGNTQIHFDSFADLEKYMANLDSIDAPYYADLNRKEGRTKVIILPLDNSGHIQLGFTEQEFEDLKTVVRNWLITERAISSIHAGFAFGGWKKDVYLN
ncbi:MAG: hypothetical protein LBV26_04460 [Bacteroidales bacterium]|jgi:hypothetical protein|nr:hypothetical protein [Bacteroidales bacterium]